MSSRPGGTARGRVALGVIAVVLVAGSATAAAVLTLGGGQAAPAARFARVTGPGTAWSRTASKPAAASKAATVPDGWSMIATVKRTTPRYAAPGGRPDGTVPALWHGAPSALPVIGQRPGWLDVRLATRPNGSTAWVRSAGLKLSATPYRIVVDLATMHLRLFERGKLVMDAPAGIGTVQDPTPDGHYFVALFEEPPSAGYGPFVIVTSAHSNAITDWDDSGDALIGIHGPLGAGASIGTTGAVLSHGCVRLALPYLDRLGQVPAGTPLTITGRAPVPAA